MSNDLLLMGGSGILALAVITGFIPVIATKLVVKLYPKVDPRRSELVAELFAVPFRDRPAWVCQCLALGLTEGLSSRLREGRRKSASAGRTPIATATTRALDVIIVLVAVPVLVPVLTLAALAIRIDSRGPAMLRTIRIGRGGSEFALLKFRTMVVDTGSVPSIALSPAAFTSGDHRLTRVGRVLRATSLDELPQFWNVLTGDMSLVGSRPLSPLQVRYTTRPLSDLPRPGLTGDWQLSGNRTWEPAAPQLDSGAAEYRPRQYLSALRRTTVWGVRELLRSAAQSALRIRGTIRRAKPRR